MDLSMEFDLWRFNLRSSNTEPLVRLNVESRGNEQLMQQKTGELLRSHGERMTALEMLLSRRSIPAQCLTEPGPDDKQLAWRSMPPCAPRITAACCRGDLN